MCFPRMTIEPDNTHACPLRIAKRLAVGKVHAVTLQYEVPEQSKSREHQADNGVKHVPGIRHHSDKKISTGAEPWSNGRVARQASHLMHPTPLS